MCYQGFADRTVPEGHRKQLAIVGVFAAQSVAIGVKRFDSSTPFYSHDPNTPAACTLWWNTDDGLSCDTVLTIVGISVGQLTAWVRLTRESRYEAPYNLDFALSPTTEPVD